MNDFVLIASVTCRKVKDGVNVKLTIRHNSSEHGASHYKAKFVHIGDIDHWIARTVVNVCSDVNNLALHAAIRALEKRHCALKNIVWELLRGSGYSVTLSSTSYYNSAVYTSITVQNLILSKCEGA